MLTLIGPLVQVDPATDAQLLEDRRGAAPVPWAPLFQQYRPD